MKSFGLSLAVIEQFDRFDLMVHEQQLSLSGVISATGMWLL